MTAEETEKKFLCSPCFLWLRTLGGAVAQLGARLNGIQKVRGSNPLSSTNKFKDFQHSSKFGFSQLRPNCNRPLRPEYHHASFPGNDANIFELF